MLLAFSVSSALGYSRLNGQRRDNPRFWVLVPGRNISAYPKAHQCCVEGRASQAEQK